MNEKVTIEEIQHLQNHFWFFIYDQETMTRTLTEVNFHKFARYLTTLSPPQNLTWHILEGRIAPIQSSIRKLLIYLCQIFDRSTMDTVFLDYLRYIQRLKLIEIILRLEVQYCLLTWHLTYIQGFIHDRLMATFYRLSFVLRMLFKDIYFQKNFSQRKVYLQLKLQIQSALNFPIDSFNEEEVRLINYLRDLADLKKLGPMVFQSITYHIMKNNQDSSLTIEKMLQVLQPQLRQAQEIEKLLESDEIQKNIRKVKELKTDETTFSNVDKKRINEQNMPYLRLLQREKEQKDKEINKLNLQESVKFDTGTRFTSQVGTKRGTYMTHSAFDLQLDMVADVEEVKDRKESKKQKNYQFEKLQDCKSFFNNKDLNVAYKQEVFSSQYGADFFKGFYDQIQNRKRRTYGKAKREKEKEFNQDEADPETQFYKGLEEMTLEQHQDILNIGPHSVQVTLDDIKGNKRVKVQRGWLEGESFGKSLREEDEQDFDSEKKARQLQEQKFLGENIFNVVQNQNAPQIEAKDEKEKDRHLFYCDYAEDSDDELENKLNKAKHKAATPYDWRKIQAIDDPLGSKNIFGLLKKQSGEPIKKMSLEKVRAKGWSKLRKMLELKMIVDKKLPRILDSQA